MHCQQLKYFISLVEKHSFTEAAQECFITQSALSQQIKSLEKDLGCNLLLRKGKTFEITPAGKFFYSKGLQILQSIEQLNNQVKIIDYNMGSGMRLGFMSSMVKDKFPSVLKEQILNRTGCNLSIEYGSHDDLYDAIGKGIIQAFISEDCRLKESEILQKIPLFNTKLYLEVAKNNQVEAQGLKKLKIDNTQLSEFALYFVCNPTHLVDEQARLQELFGLDIKIQAVENINEGRNQVLQNPHSALIIDRSILRGDIYKNDKIQRYEILKEGVPVKRTLCCYSKKSFGQYELNELIQILKEMSKKDSSKNSNSSEHSLEANSKNPNPVQFAKPKFAKKMIVI